MNAYQHSSGIMALGTVAANSLLFTIKNKDATGGRTILMKRLRSIQGFSGTAASTMIPFELVKIASGTPGAGSGSAATSAIGKRNGTAVDSCAEVRWGPTAITGPTDPGAGKAHKSTFLTHQNAGVVCDDIIADSPMAIDSEPMTLAPGEIIGVYNRLVSVAGSFIGFDAEWKEAAGA